jgi:hypothetical protein
MLISILTICNYASTIQPNVVDESIDGRSALAYSAAIEYVRAKYPKVYKRMDVSTFVVTFHYREKEIEVGFSPKQFPATAIRSGTADLATDGFRVRINRTSNKEFGIWVSQ